MTNTIEFTPAKPLNAARAKQAVERALRHVREGRAPFLPLAEDASTEVRLREAFEHIRVFTWAVAYTLTKYEGHRTWSVSSALRDLAFARAGEDDGEDDSDEALLQVARRAWKLLPAVAQEALEGRHPLQIYC